MGRIHRIYLPGSKLYACSNCHCHLTSHDDIVSKSFQGRTGRAYLFNTVVNVSLGPTEDRILNTGLHKVLSGALPLAWQSVASCPPLFARPRSLGWIEGRTIVPSARIGQLFLAETLCLWPPVFFPYAAVCDVPPGLGYILQLL
jgi:hypothetical protein